MKENKILEDFNKSKLKWIFILKLWLLPTSNEIYINKDIVYYILLFIWVFFILSKFLTKNYYIIIDHVNILNFLNISLIYIFLVIFWLILSTITLFSIDIILITISKLLKKLNISILKKYRAFCYLNIIVIFIIINILIIDFTFQTQENQVIVKTTYQKESFTWVIDYYSGENYIIKTSNWFIVIPNDKIEYLFYGNNNKNK